MFPSIESIIQDLQEGAARLRENNMGHQLANMLDCACGYLKSYAALAKETGFEVCPCGKVPEYAGNAIPDAVAFFMRNPGAAIKQLEKAGYSTEDRLHDLELNVAYTALKELVLGKPKPPLKELQTVKIDKSTLKSMWYTDDEGNMLPDDDDEDRVGGPEGATGYVTRWPNEVNERHYRYIKPEVVKACKHPRKYVQPTYGWIDGVFGRECRKCHGTQIRKKWHLWPREWEAEGSYEFFTGSCHYGDYETIRAMVDSGDFTWKEAILAYTSACERCMNVLANKYRGPDGDGYPEFSDEWKVCNTSCKFCEGFASPYDPDLAAKKREEQRQKMAHNK